MQAEPQEQHRWLAQLVGDWRFESEAPAGQGEPPCQSSGTERVRPLGALWILCEGEGDMPGGGMARMLMTLGYDPGRGVFVGNWIGSMMTHMWIYEGRLDAGQRVLTLDTTGPSFKGDGQTARYRDVITLVGQDERTLTSFSLQEDGSWHQFMTTTYRRQAS